MVKHKLICIPCYKCSREASAPEVAYIVPFLHLQSDIVSGNNATPKFETRESCRYGSSSMAGGAVGSQQGMFQQVNYLGQTSSHLSGMWTKPETTGLYPSLSEQSLETDEASFHHPPMVSSIPVPQTNKLPFSDLHQTQQLQSSILAYQPLIPDEKQMKYEDERNISVGSEQKHQTWQSHYQQQKQQQVASVDQEGIQGEQVQPVTSGTEMEEIEYYTYELDELGEG